MGAGMGCSGDALVMRRLGWPAPSMMMVVLVRRQTAAAGRGWKVRQEQRGGSQSSPVYKAAISAGAVGWDGRTGWLLRRRA